MENHRKTSFFKCLRLRLKIPSIVKLIILFLSLFLASVFLSSCSTQRQVIIREYDTDTVYVNQEIIIPVDTVAILQNEVVDSLAEENEKLIREIENFENLDSTQRETVKTLAKNNKALIEENFNLKKILLNPRKLNVEKLNIIKRTTNRYVEIPKDSFWDKFKTFVNWLCIVFTLVALLYFAYKTFRAKQ